MILVDSNIPNRPFPPSSNGVDTIIDAGFDRYPGTTRLRSAREAGPCR
jgi:hypothetical protein